MVKGAFYRHAPAVWRTLNLKSSAMVGKTGSHFLAIAVLRQHLARSSLIGRLPWEKRRVGGQDRDGLPYAIHFYT
jgi:hypothetical protein